MANETTMLVKVETGANSNKFYEVVLDGDTVHARWGRVGADGQRKDYPGGRGQYDRLIDSKERKGYVEVEVVDGGTAKPTNGAALRQATLRGLAKPDFTDDSRIADVIDRIVKVNAHSIATTSGGRIELSDGQLKTPLGVIGRRSLDRADTLLADLTLTTDRAAQVPLLEEYLTLVPQRVGSRRGWEDALLTPEALGEQSEFVRQLRDSLDFVETQQADDTEVGFRFSMGVIEPDDPRFTQVDASFRKTLNSAHPSRRYRLVGLYDVTDSPAHMKAYAGAKARLGNERWLWHGTRASNVLSILASGLYCPPANAGFVTGRMFGNGIYGSNQSTKSLNYSANVWNGGRLPDRAFMFSMQVAAGRSYTPSSSWRSSWADVHKQYDTIDVPPGTAGVINHELICWNLDQINLRYLCEFELKG